MVVVEEIVTKKKPKSYDDYEDIKIRVEKEIR